MSSRIGFMQGRLSPMVGGRIQAFPWENWPVEFERASECGISLMEWTLDQDRLYENPLLTIEGQAEIRALCEAHGISVISLTGDCFMQAPFWKTSEEKACDLKADFLAIVDACDAVDIGLIVVPLVDNGRLDNLEQEDLLIDFLQEKSAYFASRNVRIIFESDFAPAELARFIDRLDPALFGINYDIGNSAALGFLPEEEFGAYGVRVINVHVKDRVLGGTTVPLGTGNAKFATVFTELAKLDYRGKFILQTARATDNSHADTLCRYRDMTNNWILQSGMSDVG